MSYSDTLKMASFKNIADTGAELYKNIFRIGADEKPVLISPPLLDFIKAEKFWIASIQKDRTNPASMQDAQRAIKALEATGLNQKQIAILFATNPSTLSKWINEDPRKAERLLQKAIMLSSGVILERVEQIATEIEQAAILQKVRSRLTSGRAALNIGGAFTHG